MRKNLKKSKCLGLISRPELAAMLGISAQRLAYHIENGSIPNGKKKLGKRYHYTPEQAKEIVERLAGVIPQ